MLLTYHSLTTYLPAHDLLATYSLLLLTTLTHYSYSLLLLTTLTHDLLTTLTHRAQDLGAPEHLLIDRAHMLGLTAPEMAVLVAGLRVLDAGSSPTGVLSSKGVAV